jgi:hypothetical protein
MVAFKKETTSNDMTCFLLPVKLKKCNKDTTINTTVMILIFTVRM